VLQNANDVGSFLRSSLAGVRGVTEVRGEGLLIGFDLDGNYAAGAVTEALAQGFIINAPTPHTLRLAPPLILTRSEAQSFLDALPGILDSARDTGARTNAAQTTEAPA
jgi:acetylornithine aminotransferase